MSTESLENYIAQPDLGSRDCTTPEEPTLELEIKQLAGEICEQSKVIVEQSKFNLNDKQLESVAAGLARAGIRVVIGF